MLMGWKMVMKVMFANAVEVLVVPVVLSITVMMAPQTRP